MDDTKQINELIAACKTGSNEAFSKLIDMYSKRCYGYFYRLTGNAALSNDLLSELFVKLVKKIGTFKEGSFESWVFTVASNMFRDHLRRQYRHKKMIETKTRELRSHTPQTKAESRMIDKLQDNLEKLDPETAELLMLRFYGQFSFKELAEARSEPIGTTLSKVHRGLKKLRILMDEDND